MTLNELHTPHEVQTPGRLGVRIASRRDSRRVREPTYSIMARCGLRAAEAALYCKSGERTDRQVAGIAARGFIGQLEKAAGSHGAHDA